MNNYFQETEYFNTKSTSPSDEEKNKKQQNQINFNFDDFYYTNRKSAKRVVGYIEKQN